MRKKYPHHSGCSAPHSDTVPWHNPEQAPWARGSCCWARKTLQGLGKGMSQGHRLPYSNPQKRKLLQRKHFSLSSLTCVSAPMGREGAQLTSKVGRVTPPHLLPPLSLSSSEKRPPLPLCSCFTASSLPVGGEAGPELPSHQQTQVSIRPYETGTVSLDRIE